MTINVTQLNKLVMTACLVVVAFLSTLTISTPSHAGTEGGDEGGEPVDETTLTDEEWCNVSEERQEAWCTPSDTLGVMVNITKCRADMTTCCTIHPKRCKKHRIWGVPGGQKPDLTPEQEAWCKEHQTICESGKVDITWCMAEPLKCKALHPLLWGQETVGDIRESQAEKHAVIECRTLAQKLILNFETKWENDASSVYLPAPNQWMSAPWWVILIILAGFQAWRRLSKESRGKPLYKVIFAAVLFAAMSLLRMQLWAEEMRPVMTEDYVAYQEVCGQFEEEYGDYQVIATFETRWEKAGSAAKTAWETAKAGLNIVSEHVADEKLFADKMEERDGRNWLTAKIVKYIEGYSMVEDPEMTTAIGRWFWSIFIAVALGFFYWFVDPWLPGLWEARSDGWVDIKAYILTSGLETPVQPSGLASPEPIVDKVKSGSGVNQPAPTDQPPQERPGSKPESDPPRLRLVDFEPGDLGSSLELDVDGTGLKSTPAPKPKPAPKAPPKRQFCANCGARVGKKATNCQSCGAAL